MDRSRVFYLSMSRPRQWLRLVRELHAQPFDLVYLNSLWEPTFTIIRVMALRLGLVQAKNILLTPCGELSPGALTIRARKKRLFFKAWRPLLKSMDIGWHTSTERDAIDIRTTFPDARVTANSNQVSLPDEALPVRSGHEGPVRLVFISRISPKRASCWHWRPFVNCPCLLSSTSMALLKIPTTGLAASQ